MARAAAISNRGFPDLAPLALERLRGRLRADPADNVASDRATLQTVLAEQRAAREADALKLALLGQAIDADSVFDLHCSGERCAPVCIALAGGRGRGRWRRGVGAAAILLEEGRAVIRLTKPAPVHGGNCVRRWRRKAVPAGLFRDHGGTARADGCER
ncbi:MAG: hypothetical protein R3F44_02585 [Candidatus Competibacteraceae bacterium]